MTDEEFAAMSLEAREEYLERERRQGDIAKVRDEMEWDRLQRTIIFGLGTILLEANGGGAEALIRLGRDPAWRPHLDAYFDHKKIRKLLGLEPAE